MTDFMSLVHGRKRAGPKTELGAHHKNFHETELIPYCLLKFIVG